MVFKQSPIKLRKLRNINSSLLLLGSLLLCCIYLSVGLFSGIAVYIVSLYQCYNYGLFEKLIVNSQLFSNKGRALCLLCTSPFDYLPHIRWITSSFFNSKCFSEKTLFRVDCVKCKLFNLVIFYNLSR